MFPDQERGRPAHGVHIKWPCLPYELSSLWYYKAGVDPEGVGVALAQGAKAGVETARGDFGRQDRHISGDQGVEGALPGQSGALRRHVGVGHLFQGVDPGVGAGRAVRPDRDPGQGGQGLFQAALDGAGRTRAGLKLPALELCALVG